MGATPAEKLSKGKSIGIIVTLVVVPLLLLATYVCFSKRRRRVVSGAISACVASLRKRSSKNIPKSDALGKTQSRFEANEQHNHAGNGDQHNNSYFFSWYLVSHLTGSDRRGTRT
jgi:hypothetical protein